MLHTIIRFHHLGMEALKKGAPMNKLFNLPVRETIARMRYLEEKNISDIDKIEEQIKKEVNDLFTVGGESYAA